MLMTTVEKWTQTITRIGNCGNRTGPGQDRLEQTKNIICHVRCLYSMSVYGITHLKSSLYTAEPQEKFVHVTWFAHVHSLLSVLYFTAQIAARSFGSGLGNRFSAAKTETSPRRKQSNFFHIKEARHTTCLDGWAGKKRISEYLRWSQPWFMKSRLFQASPDALRQVELTGSKLDPSKRLAIPIWKVKTNWKTWGSI